MYQFKTIKKAIEDTLLKEKGSKFLGYAYPVSTEDDIKNVLENIKEKHPKATHHCYAYRLGISGENYRANDDGEPSGSAGLPIYNQLLAHELTNILLIVVRYYGGTKLGVSGLVKTYKETAKITLEEAQIIEKELEETLEVQFNFSQQNMIFTLLNKFDTKILEFKTNELCTIVAQIKCSEKQSISEKLSEMPYIQFKFY